MEGTPYSTNVLRNFLRCKRDQTLSPNKVVDFVNTCTNNVRDSGSLSDFEMICNSNQCIFIQKMEERRWKINDIYVDHYIILDL